MKIRAAIEEDCIQMAEIHLASWRNAYKGIVDQKILDGLDRDQRSEAWKALLSSSSWPVFVAADLGKITGFVSVCEYRDDDLDSATVGEVSAIYIVPSLIRTGLGAALFRKGLDFLENSGFHQVALWVLEDNFPTISFYENFGFAHDGGKKTHPTMSLVELRYIWSTKYA